MENEILDKIKEIIEILNGLSITEKINILNNVKKLLHDVSPQKEPVDNVQWVPAAKVVANDYNPNRVAPPEMELLRLSIEKDGYTQPIVTYYDDENDIYVVVDGFHRNRVGKEIKEINSRIHDYLPVVVIEKPIDERMASTIRHNRARGTHAIVPMAKVVEQLYFAGWSNKRIGEELGMEKDEVLRLKQFTGIGALFESREYSKSWE